MASSTTGVHVNYQEEAEKILSFMQKFQETGAVTEAGEPRLKYIDMLQKVADRESNEVVIDLDDIAKFLEPTEDLSLLRNIERNTKRYVDLFCKAVDTILPEADPMVNEDSDPLDVIMHHIRQLQNNRPEGPAAAANANPTEASARLLPPSLTRRYSLLFHPRSQASKALAVREIKAEHVGALCSVRAIVTRVSDVKPLVTVNTMSCDVCGCEVFQEVNARAFTPLVECPSTECKRNQTKGKLHMQTRASRHLKFQEVKVQELSDQVPMGHIPRTMTVHLYEAQCRKVNPGDVVVIHGILLPLPYTGYRALRAGLITDIILEATQIEQLKKSYEEMELTEEIAQEIQELSTNSDLYGTLARSIAPEIWGHEDVKKALLLQLVGGVDKNTDDGMKIRGDINVCLMGDPGVAKSQLLKYISRAAPRGVYTTGRGSSGVGLTASVMKDPVTGEMILEGGALVLADNGICCIDEFDKMDDSDRTAIHEVMEQQTISISKAGITTTLNARTSILAAANPQFGRYNRKKKPTENINLPAALLSRFDLLFLILDTPSMDDDLRLAQHVTWVHMMERHPNAGEGVNAVGKGRVVTMDVMRHYIARARTFRPTVPAHVAKHVVEAYVHYRNRVDGLADFQYTCARTLLSIIRMATALARLRFSETVETGDVDEALRLMEVSKSSLAEESEGGRSDPTSRIYDIITELGRLRSWDKLKYSEVLQRVKSKGYSQANLDATLEIYERLDILYRSATGEWVQFTEVNDKMAESDEEL